MSLRGLADLPLPTIASRVGYESDVAFVRMFKRQSGSTPTAWRKSGATSRSDSAVLLEAPVVELPETDRRE